MHKSAMDFGAAFFDYYWQPDFKCVLDVGSQDVNGSLRTVTPEGATFVGVDMVAGKGVDVVLADPYTYPYPDGHFDAVISTSCWEHDPMFWLTFLEGLRVLSPRGFMYVNAPSSGRYHGYPLDFWRFFPDAGVALEMWGKRMSQPVKLIESFTFINPVKRAFNDCVMVFTKDRAFVPERYIQDGHAAVFNGRKGVVMPLEANRDTLLNPKRDLHGP
jgi:hypothetical protein